MVRQRLDELIAAIPDAEDAYDLALSVVGCVSDVMEESELASRLYILWADITDFYELRPDHDRPRWHSFEKLGANGRSG